MQADSQNSALQCSPFLERLIDRHPGWLDSLRNSGRLENPVPPASGDLLRAIGEEGLDPALRRFRNREMLRLIWRDLNGLAPIDEILADLSLLADICLRAAVDHHGKAFEEKYGIPRDSENAAQKLVVIGLGKLGGNELNLSSDVDIIFCYPQRAACDGRRGLSGEQFFTRLARSVIRSLSEVTADGFCFRVDTRLRPFGESGPLVSSFAALEQYYQREGRDWERYALIKARPVAGDRAAGRQLMTLLRPFVYRRYIDFGAIEALREMHANVREDAMRKDRLDDIKRGPGGIREIEFLVQTFQLLRGGREPTLQTASIFKAASSLRQLGLLPAETVADLLSAYRFLRRVENRIQALHDQQTHVIPGGDDGLRVARAMQFENVPDFLVALRDTRKLVQRLFEQSLPGPAAGEDGQDPWHARWQRLRNGLHEDDPGFRGGKPLADFVKRLNRLSLSQRASRRLDQYMPVLLRQVDSMAPGDAVLSRVLDLVSSICRRSAYLALLVQNPDAGKKMLELFAASEKVARVVTRYPALLDELIDPSLGRFPPTQTGIKEGVERILKGNNDTETALQELNYLKQVVSLRVAVAVLQSSMSAEAAQHTLSQLAQSMVQAALVLSRIELEKRHGRLPGPGLAVIAYGSLGARAPGFESDLDLIFLYEPVENRSDGARPVSAERYHTGVARRMLSLLAATTPSGRLYSIDARLRPNGRAGLLVSTVDAFRRYQRNEAWTWELQALTRARAVAGNPDIGLAFDDIRQTVLTERRDKRKVRREIIEMRERIRAAHTTGHSLKHSPGGLLDIEFVAQLGLLQNAHEHPEVVKSTQVSGQLRALRECGWINERDFKTLDQAYTGLTRARQLEDLAAGRGVEEVAGLLANSQALCKGILG